MKRHIYSGWRAQDEKEDKSAGGACGNPLVLPVRISPLFTPTKSVSTPAVAWDQHPDLGSGRSAEQTVSAGWWISQCQSEVGSFIALSCEEEEEDRQEGLIIIL
ncbi:hypothetical protein SKAU_G00295610 [Synaphobranchus kaupii]|uniref:Uncharacterized protein n=1 Tax=Synaphobranchus kaupii TaxID=118154 RepID=A0A9Q1EUR1_SYNKA|nr:hypothetical protein SKAU_G00295610 [Synaphobranchus kaupii]